MKLERGTRKHKKKEGLKGDPGINNIGMTSSPKWMRKNDTKFQRRRRRKKRISC